MENNKIDTKRATLALLKPVETRRSTDQLFLPLVPLSLLLWLGIGISEILRGSVSTFVWQDLKRICPDLLIHGVTAVLVIVLLLFLLNTLNDDWLVFAVTFSVLALVSIAVMGILWKLFYPADLDLKWSLLVLSVLGVILVYNVVIFISTKELDAACLGSTIGEPVRAIAHSFATSILSLVAISLSMIVLVVTVMMAFYIFIPYMFYLIYAPSEFTWNWLLMRLRIFTFALVSVYVFKFIWNLGFMVKGDYLANYYDSRDSSWTDVFQSIARVSRYHLGTVAFLTMPILPPLCALIMALKTNKPPAKQSDYALINFISKLSLIIDISEYALVHTSVYGSDSLKSMRRMIELQYSNPLLFLVFNAISVKVMDLIKIATLITGWLALLAIHYLFASQSSMVTLALSVVFVHSINTLLVRPITCTFAIDRMIRGQQEYN